MKGGETMQKHMKVIIGVVVTVIGAALLMHLGKNWLIPMIIRMHQGG